MLEITRNSIRTRSLEALDLGRILASTIYARTNTSHMSVELYLVKVVPSCSQYHRKLRTTKQGNHANRFMERVLLLFSILTCLHIYIH